MCTESLGSETGSDISEISSENNYYYYSRPSKCGKKHSTTTTNKTLVAHFPPPLTSINNGLQLRSHREGDRLILKATTITAPKSCFKAERLDGRLRLSFWNNLDESDSTKLLGENGYIRPRKCNSRIKGIPTNWEPFWVSIS
uniref:Putative ovule protein n=1 Tax=Solanum chacoense TaxID=4108 RepID=A0A0V0HD77_SOLCH